MANHFDNNKEMEGQKKVQKKKLSFNWANWSKLPQMVHNFQLWREDSNTTKHTDVFKWDNIDRALGTVPNTLWKY